jgi:excisionase family DNA binding protein
MPRKKPAVPVAITPSLPPRGLRVAEAAQYAGATVSLMRTLISTGAVPAIRLGKRDVILRDDLDAYLDSLRRRFPK